MSTIAGVVGFGATAEHICSELLLSQEIYGGNGRSIGSAGAATFGSSKAGGQALSKNHGRLIVSDIRLDNREELIGALGLRCGADKPSDSEILRIAWEKWGKASLDRLNGDYAIAVYDSNAQLLILARDPTGQFPLFFKTDGSALAFASMPLALNKLLGPSDINLGLIATCLEQRPVDAKESFFERVGKVRAGEIVEVRNGSLSRHFHWNPDPCSGAALKSGEYVEEYRALLDSAVASRIRGRPRPVGSQLSSGWDSSAVTATAARLVSSRSDLIAYTSAPLPGADANLFRHRFSDESELAAETAQMHAIKHVIVRETGPILNVIVDQGALRQEPVFAPFNMAWWAEIRGRARDAGVTTLLTGEMGNMTLNAGGLHVLREFIRDFRWRNWWRESKLLTQRPDVRWRGVLANSFMPWIPSSVFAGLERLFLDMPKPEESSFVRQHWRDKAAHAVAEPQAKVSLHQSMLSNLRLCEYGTQRKSALAAGGIRECDPMSDRRIIEFALKLPPEQLVHHGELRPLARRALGDRVPPNVLNALQRGLQSADWHLRISPSDARQMLEMISPNAAVDDLLDLKKMARTIDRWPTCDFNSYNSRIIYSNGLVSALAAGLFIARHAR